ncbi:phosphohydrolase [halophilic archaeon]|nr:phosphohydrolase [halophilic archaeon]
MDAIDALAAAFALKDERRTGWQLRGVDDPESVAGHAWGVALLCLQYADEAGVDEDRALRLAVVHDLAEAETGDVATRADADDQRVDGEEKVRRERAAMDDLAAPLSDDVRALWEEYEARETPAARFVKDMDLIDMCLQALVYERADRYAGDDGEQFDEYDDLDEFFATAEPRLRTDVGERLFAAIRARYEDAK